MLSRPTTEQILLDCRRELLETIDPAIDAEHVKVAVQMLENVLRNCAARAAHEIAWMCEESDAMLEFARRVAADVPGSTEVERALATYEGAPRTSLHLEDVCSDYSAAGECLSTAVEAAATAGNARLLAAGRELLEVRLAHENEIMGEWAFVGRG